VDLFEPGSGFTTQVHDYNPGIAPSGLFWTIRVPESAFSRDENSATISLGDLGIVDSFQFLSGVEVPATVSYEITWTATGPVRHLRPVSDDPLDPRNLAGEFRDALATGTFSGRSVTALGGSEFTFEGNASSEFVWAEMGTERNGWFLKK